MPKKVSKKALKWIAVAVIGAAILVFGGFKYWKARQARLPEGIAAGNGRLEAKLLDVSAKEPLRVKEIHVDEGAMVKPGDVLVRLDTTTLESELSEAKANVAAAEERLAFAKASIVKQQREIELAQVEVDRAQNLFDERAGSKRDLDVRETKLDTTRASLAESRAMLETAKQRVEAAKATAGTVQTRIDDATLTSPVNGRVLYRLAEAGEVLAAGGKALTLVNMEDVYMEIFLPSQQAARARIGAEARITVDADPTRAVAGYVSFVSPEAQFTPKQVETKDERDKLM
ncbi:MAG TPA: HlyD family efflux transporter periplasmic adaptor subunit, partial [Polyangiaceae bacterium]|nr:HlyD family efflux transporter periplasmic adaptor subunit [Polyangiaceae bacterium]